MKKSSHCERSEAIYESKQLNIQNYRLILFRDLLTPSILDFFYMFCQLHIHSDQKSKIDDRMKEEKNNVEYYGFVKVYSNGFRLFIFFINKIKFIRNLIFFKCFF